MKNFLQITSLVVLLFSLETKAQGIFLRIGGPGYGGPFIAGGSVNPLHNNEIELASLQEGAGKGCSGAVCSPTSQSELTVTGVLGISFLPLREAMINNTPLTIRVSQAKPTYDAVQIYMENVQITGLSVSSGGDTPSISISFNSAKWQHTFRASDVATPVKFGWNFETNTPFSSPN